MLFSDYKPAHTKGTFLASLENVPFVLGQGFTPDTPENGTTEKSKIFQLCRYRVIPKED